MKYRKTALIEAEQYKPGMEDGLDESGPYLNTLEGRLYIPENGWIATGSKGERWAIQDDIFREIYEPVGIDAKMHQLELMLKALDKE